MTDETSYMDSFLDWLESTTPEQRLAQGRTGRDLPLHGPLCAAWTPASWRQDCPHVSCWAITDQTARLPAPRPEPPS